MVTNNNIQLDSAKTVTEQENSKKTTIMKNLILSLGIFSILSSNSLVSGLHQDQVGKFDWRKQLVGIPKFVYQNPASDNIIIGTQSNVIASIHARDGSIIWRQQLANNCQLNHMSVLKSNEEFRDYLVKIGCTAPAASNHSTAREYSNVWNPQNGLLVSESKLKEFLEDDQAESIKTDLSHSVGNSLAFPLTESTDLLVSEDGVVSYRVHEKIIWSREESLASVVAAEIVKLPSDMRDKFGLKKTIVLVTQMGKVFGLDTITGEIVWHLFDKDFASTSQQQAKHIALVIMKQSDDLESESSAVVVHPNGLLMRLNPVTGQLLEKVKLYNSIKQFALTGLIDQADDDQSRGVIILDTKDTVHIYPASHTDYVTSNLNKYYMTLVEQSPVSTITGYKFVIRNGEIKPSQIWTLPLNTTEKIVSISIKRIDEETHSPARVLGDRGILYKYVNPNVIAIMTESSVGDPCSPDQSVNIYLVDGVTGALVHSIHHQKARGPSRMVHSENWLVYSYFNSKSRRTEVSSLEMFEGINQVNSSAFSSLTRSHIKPRLIEHKSFIFPAGIEAMVDTTTLRGMTNKHIIVALHSGALLEIPKIFLDPRRPINMLPEHREEGLIPYMPELPIPSESMINYDQILLSVRGIVTSPAILESTSLVFSYGLDLFFTRVTPSKTFDILKDDFDHILISGVLVFLVVASLGTKYLAQRKALRAAWK